MRGKAAEITIEETTSYSLENRGKVEEAFAKGNNNTLLEHLDISEEPNAETSRKGKKKRKTQLRVYRKTPQQIQMT